jgi:hypothetical protein
VDLVDAFNSAKENESLPASFERVDSRFLALLELSLAQAVDMSKIETLSVMMKSMELKMKEMEKTKATQDNKFEGMSRQLNAQVDKGLEMEKQLIIVSKQMAGKDRQISLLQNSIRELQSMVEHSSSQCGQPAAPVQQAARSVPANDVALVSMITINDEVNTATKPVEKDNASSWTEVVKKNRNRHNHPTDSKARQPAVVGRKNDESLKGVASKPAQSHFCVYRVSKEHSADDIASFCNKHDVRVIACREVCIDRYSSRSFRLITSADSARVMDADFWPSHIQCRPWNFYSKDE